MREDLDYLLWRIETEKIYMEAGRSDNELKTLPYKKKAWRRGRLVRVSLIPRAFVLGAMQATPNVDGSYPMPRGIGVIARKLMLSISQMTSESVMLVSTVALLKWLREWTSNIKEFLDWKDLEDPLDLESVLYNAACQIEAETGWIPRQRFLNFLDEQQDWQQIKLVHISLVSQGLAAGTMMEAAAKDSQSGHPCNWPLPPYANMVIKWVNWNVGKQLSEKHITSEVLRISPYSLMEHLKGWLTSNPYYRVWGNMGQQSLDLDVLLIRSIRWMNGEINSMMADKVEDNKPKEDEDEDMDEEDRDLLGQLKIT